MKTGTLIKKAKVSSISCTKAKEKKVLNSGYMKKHVIKSESL